MRLDGCVRGEELQDGAVVVVFSVATLTMAPHYGSGVAHSTSRDTFHKIMARSSTDRRKFGDKFEEAENLGNEMFHSINDTIVEIDMVLHLYPTALSQPADCYAK